MTAFYVLLLYFKNWFCFNKIYVLNWESCIYLISLDFLFDVLQLRCRTTLVDHGFCLLANSFSIWGPDIAASELLLILQTWVVTRNDQPMEKKSLTFSLLIISFNKYDEEFNNSIFDMEAWSMWSKQRVIGFAVNFNNAQLQEVHLADNCFSLVAYWRVFAVDSD